MENETKLFMLVSSDVEFSTREFITPLSNAMRNHMIALMSNEDNRKRAEYYYFTQPNYPKICKRFKSKHIPKILESLKTLEMPWVEIKDNNKIYGYLIGPCKRNELPKDIDSLQLMQDNKITLEPSDTKEVIEVGYRHDIKIPVGKLIPQFAHALQKFWCEVPSVELFNPHTPRISLCEKTKEEMIREGNYITDAARTYFTEPTVTTNYTISAV